jgi:hypothetical protein
MTTPLQGQIGQKLSQGESVLTSSGRTTTPFPKVNFASYRKAHNTLVRVDQWLIHNAKAEAVARGDHFNAIQFGAINANWITQSDKDCAEQYLFGEQPDVVRCMLQFVETV